MKYIVATVLALSLASPVLANEGCGLGKIPFSGFSVEVKQSMGMPYFVHGAQDPDGKLEGRQDSVWMIRHNICVDGKQN